MSYTSLEILLADASKAECVLIGFICACGLFFWYKIIIIVLEILLNDLRVIVNVVIDTTVSCLSKVINYIRNRKNNKCSNTHNDNK